MRKLKKLNNIEDNEYPDDNNEEMDDLEFDEMNDVWDELDNLDI